ncbi:hypothetical protein ACQJBY_069060 [Aegilops geniculata]
MAGAVPDPRGYALELRRPPLHRLQPPVRAEALHNLAIWSSSPPRPRRHRRRSPPPAPPSGFEHVDDLPRNPVTAADAAVIDYLTDDPPSRLSNQMSEPRSQMPPPMHTTTWRPSTTRSS